MTADFATITQLFIHYGYWIVFPVAIMEGPTISLISGFLVSLKIFNAFIVFFVLVMGDVVGDTMYYLLGRYAGEWFVRNFGKYIGATPARVSSLTEKFHTFDGRILLFGKTQPIGSLILFVAGIVKLKYLRFMKYNMLGSIPKIILFMTIGYYFGKTISTSTKYVDYFSYVWLLVSVILIAGYFFIKSYIKKNAFKDTV
ncbi:MAG: VTT domain-containing protein [Patescibacteria group bacterium]|nr:VTT domain-containing protein [Patescibacteria group bacterium]